MFHSTFVRPRSVTRKLVHLLALASIAGVTALSTMGCGQDRKDVPGVQKFYSGVVNDYFYVSFVSPTLQIDGGLTVPIPGLQGATFSITPDFSSNGTLFQFAAPLAAMASHGNFYPASALPDGRAIPDVSGGVLPRWDVQIGSLLASFYLSPEAFGLFIPVIFTTQSGMVFPVTLSAVLTDPRGNLLGKIYLVPTGMNGKGSGIFILLPFPGGSSSGLKG